jgi:coenzyme F420-reducing hydrogenase delta subunit
MFNLSAAMAGEFVEAAVAMTDQIHKLGPNPLRVREDPKLQAES